MLNCASSARKIWAILSRDGQHIDKERSFRYESQCSVVPASLLTGVQAGERGELVDDNCRGRRC